MQNVNELSWKNVPDNFGPMREASANARFTGPCGDTMEFWLLIHDSIVSKASFITDGCCSSIRCGSAAANIIERRSISEIESLSPEVILDTLTDVPAESSHCALLALKTIKAALASFTRPVAPVPPPQPRGRVARHSIVVLSGKGGVGKSTVAVNLAASFARRGFRVGLLDVDVHGPSLPTMLNLTYQSMESEGGRIVPLTAAGMKVVSVGLLMQQPNAPIIWRGPMKANVIRQLIEDVAWGDLDFLFIDSPPGTGDEPLSVCQLVKPLDGAIIVTTPQEVAAADVRRSINFCKQLSVPILGLIENMSWYMCSKCGTKEFVFGSGAGQAISKSMNVSLLGQLPFDIMVGESGDKGIPFVNTERTSATTEVFQVVVDKIVGQFSESSFSDGKKSANHQETRSSL